MGLFRKNKGTPLKELERYHGKRVSYVVEREGADENVIGRTGGISVDSEKLVVVCDGHEVFRCSTDGIVCAELQRSGYKGQGYDHREASPYRCALRKQKVIFLQMYSLCT